MAEVIGQSKFFRHVNFVENEEEWNTTLDLLEGKHSRLVSKYLWFHAMEDPSRQCDERDKESARLDRMSREERTQYINYMKMIQERFVSLIMKGGLILGEETESLFEPEEKANIDGNGNSIEVFVNKAVEDLVAYGVMYVFTDTHTIYARNISEEQQANARPYWIKIDPLALPDWQIASDGSYQAFRYEYMLLKERTSLEEEPTLLLYTTLGQINQTSKLYELTTYVSTDEKGVNINYHPDVARRQLHHSWRKLETTPVEGMDVLPLATNRISRSPIARCVPVVLKLFNKESDLDNILYDQGYDRVFVFSDLAMAQGADGEVLSDEAKQVKISTNSMVILPEGGAVEKLEPTDPKALIESIRDDFLNLMRIAFNIARQTPTDSRVAEGAETRREAKEDLLTRIETLREAVVSVFKNAIKHYAKFKKRQEVDPEISFAQSLTEADLSELTNFVNTFANRIDRYPTVTKEVDKKLISHLNLPAEDALFEEVDGTKIPSPMEVLKAESQLRMKSFVNNG